MEENMNISNSEMKVMNKIWEMGEMVTVPDMVTILNMEGEEWAYQTVATFLRRLEAKGFLAVTKKGKKLCYFPCNGVQREHNKKLNNGLPILHKVPPKRDYGRYFCIIAEKGGTSHGGLTEKLSPFFHAKKQEVNAYGR